MAGRRIPIPFLAAALALAVVPPAATAWIASQRDPAPAAAPADDALEVTIEVDALEPLGGDADAAPAATAEASTAADAIATLPPGIPLPAGTPQTALVTGAEGSRTWTLVYPGADRAAYDAWLAALLAAGLESTFTLEQGDLRSESLAGDGFTAQAQYVEGVGIALTAHEG